MLAMRFSTIFSVGLSLADGALPAPSEQRKRAGMLESHVPISW